VIRLEGITGGILLRILAAGSFSLMSGLMKLAAETGVTAPEMMFYRAVFGLPVVLAWVVMGPGLKAITTRRPLMHLWRCALGVTGILCLFQALTLLPLADATTLGFTAPMFATLLSFLFLKETVGRHRWLAVLVGFVGVMIVMRPGGDALPAVGVAFALIGAGFSAGVTVTLRHLNKTEHVAAIVFWFFIACAVVGALLLPAFGSLHPPLAFGFLIGAGMAGGVAQLAMTESLRLAPVSAVTPFDYLQIAGAVLFGWLALSVAPSISSLAGAALIIASGLYTAWREQVRRRAVTAPTPPI
jgi:drug/metabolite transporter (DMT)-like permease